MLTTSPGRSSCAGFPPLLVKPSTSHADEDLPTAAFGVMDVPVVAAAGLERHVVDTDLLGGKGREVALPDKVLREASLGAPMGKTISFWC